MKATFTAEQWSKMTEQQKLNEIKKAAAECKPIFLPAFATDQVDDQRLCNEADAFCAIQYVMNL